MTPTTSSSEKPTVLVVGAGLAGLSLSLGLTRLGVSVQLVEKGHNFGRTGATLGLQLNGQKALRELGVATDFSTMGLAMPEGGIMLGWWNVRDALLEQARECPDIAFHMGWMLQEVTDEPDRVVARFAKRPTGDAKEPDLTLEGCLLVGADGVNSIVRDQLGLAQAKKTDITCWRGRLVLQDDDPASDVLRPWLDVPIMPTGIRLRGPMNYSVFNFHPKLPQTMSLSVNYQQKEDFAAGTNPQEHMLDTAEDDREREEIRAIAQLVDQGSFHHAVRIKVVELPKEDGAGWGGKGRITLTGDAAHAMRPASGQGGSMAFEDSVVLCRCLKKALDNGTSLADAVRDFENTRLPRVRTLWEDQWERSEKCYKNIVMEPWSKDFSAWVFDGV